MLDRAQHAFSQSDINPRTSADDEPSSPVAADPNPIRIGAIAGLLLTMVFIGSGSGLAWRAYTEVSRLTERRANDAYQLQAAIQRVELAHQQIAQIAHQVDALQQAQQQNDQVRLHDLPRLSLQLTALQGDIEKVANSESKRLEKVAKSELKPATQKKSAVTSPAAKSLTGGVGVGGASDLSSKSAAAERH